MHTLLHANQEYNTSMWVFNFSLLERVYDAPAQKAEALDPYSDDNKAPFYRQPAGIRRQKKRFEKEEAGKLLFM